MFNITSLDEENISVQYHIPAPNHPKDLGFVYHGHPECCQSPTSEVGCMVGEKILRSSQAQVYQGPGLQEPALSTVDGCTDW